MSDEPINKLVRLFSKDFKNPRGKFQIRREVLGRLVDVSDLSKVLEAVAARAVELNKVGVEIHIEERINDNNVYFEWKSPRRKSRSSDVELEKLVWVICNDFDREAGYFSFKEPDFAEIEQLFDVDVKELLEETANKLNKNVSISIEHDAPNVNVTWKPLKV